MLDAPQVGELREGRLKGWISGQCGEVAEDILLGEHTPSPTEHETSRDVDPVGCRHHRLPRATEWQTAVLGAEVGCDHCPMAITPGLAETPWLRSSRACEHVQEDPRRPNSTAIASSLQPLADRPA